MPVKGSKPRHYRVVRHHPWRAARWLLILLLGLGVGLASGVALERHLAGERPEDNRAARIRLETMLETAENQVTQYRQAVETARLGAEIDRAALESVRAEVSLLKSEVAALDEQNAFYRNLIAPTDGERGINFGRVSVKPTETPGVFDFTVVIQQIATKHRPVSGSVRLEIKGMQAGEEALLPLSQLGDSPDILPLEFTYFQTLAGTITLPEGFMPQALVLAARSVKPASKRIEQTFSWTEALAGAELAIDKDTL